MAIFWILEFFKNRDFKALAKVAVEFQRSLCNTEQILVKLMVLGNRIRDIEKDICM